MKNPKAARLKLIVETGSEKGKVFTFINGDEVVVGRGRYANIMIDDKQASRRHARIYAKDSELHIEDLDSINGTFVNGKGIDAARLAPQDTVEVANLRLLAIPAETDPKTVVLSPDAALSALAEDTSATQCFRLAGPLVENSVFDMIGSLAESKETGTLMVRVGWGTGRIFVKEGHLIAAVIDTRPELTQRKALQRLLRASSGSLQFNPGETMDYEEPLGGDIESIRAEDKNHADEFIRLVKLMPAFDAPLSVADPTETTALSHDQREILQLIVDKKSVTPVLDNFSGSDTDALKAVADFIEQGIVSF